MTVAMTAELRDRCAWLRRQLDSLPTLGGATSSSGSDWIARHHMRMVALDDLVERLRVMPDAPKIAPQRSPARVSMLGIIATSTMGVGGALSNWLAGAEALLEGESA